MRFCSPIQTAPFPTVGRCRPFLGHTHPCQQVLTLPHVSHVSGRASPFVQRHQITGVPWSRAGMLNILGGKGEGENAKEIEKS